MKRLLLLIPLILILAACQKAEAPENKPACQPSYIPFETGCCLDENNNSLCDYDETPKDTSSPKSIPVIVKQKPEEIKNCNISYAINWAKVGDACQMDGSRVTAVLMFSGKGDKIDGMWFYATAKNGTEEYVKDDGDFANGEARRYVLNFDEPITKLIALPMLTENGTDKACLNQRIIVVGGGLCG